MTSEETYYEYLISIRDNYDSNKSLRFEILRYWSSRSVFADDYTAQQNLDIKLNHIPSRVWLREKTIGYLILLQMWMDIIRGKSASDNPIMDAARIEYLRSRWLENYTFRELIVKFNSKLSQSADLFNLQMINSWLTRIVGRYELEHKLLQGLTSEIVNKSCGEADDRTYAAAEFFVTTELAPMFDCIAQEAPDWASSIVLNDKQLTHIAVVRMGGKVSLEEFAPEAAEAVEDLGDQQDLSIIDLIDEMDLFKRTESGLWVGK